MKESIIDYIDNYLIHGNYKGLVSKFTRVSNKNLLTELDNHLMNMGFNASCFYKTSQKLYHVINNIKKLPTCYCGNLLLYKNLSLGYLNYCSGSCQAKSENSKFKREKTTVDKYGVTHHSKLPEERKKVSDRHKEEPFGFGTIKFNETIKLKFGVDNISKHPEVRKKKSDNWYNMDDLYKDKLIKDRSEKSAIVRSENFTNKMIDKMSEMGLEFIKSSKYETSSGIIRNGNYHMKCNSCGATFSILKCSLYNRISDNRIICTECNPTDIFNSNIEYDVSDYIKSFYKKELILNDRKILKGKELDIYLPDLKIAFEFNGLYWHSELYKDKDYHLNKTNNCLKKDIQLIHVYEDDWVNKQNIVKSMILNLIVGNTNKICFNECEIKEINNELSKSFLEENHIQGFIASKVKLGLFHKDELVSLMVFNVDKSNKGSYKLLRFCDKLNTNVIFSFSELLKYFIENYEYKSIISYIDRSWCDIDLYEQFGFKFIQEVNPNYYYIDRLNRLNRFNFRKDKLVSEGFDINKTEHEIMFERGFYRIYDSGSLKYIFLNKNT